MASNTISCIQTTPFIDQIKAMGNGTFIDVRELADGTIIGLGKLLYTTAIYIDMDLCGWRQRYCFDDPKRVAAEYDSLASGDDTPVGWIAQRP